jgi:hypothetical protein
MKLINFLNNNNNTLKNTKNITSIPNNLNITNFVKNDNNFEKPTIQKNYEVMNIDVDLYNYYQNTFIFRYVNY